MDVQERGWLRVISKLVFRGLSLLVWLGMDVTGTKMKNSV